MENLGVCLGRGELSAPLNSPGDGQAYKTIHNAEIQDKRRTKLLPCGPRGVIHEYVAFYFGPRSPMLYQLHTGWVPGYAEGQSPLVYLVTTAQVVAASGASFVFSDGHGVASFTSWFDDLRDLDKVDWEAVYARSWKDTTDDMDRQRRKQAEFLIHRSCSWALIEEIAVIGAATQALVEEVLARFPAVVHRPVRVHSDWYY